MGRDGIFYRQLMHDSYETPKKNGSSWTTLKTWSDNGSGSATLSETYTISSGTNRVKVSGTVAGESYTLTHDGIYGSNTFKAAKEFQGNNSLAVDGEVGINTKRSDTRFATQATTIKGTSA